MKSKGQKPLRIPWCKREDNIKIDVKETGLDAFELVEPQLVRSCEYIYEPL
jgi:hypothetical protein